PERRVCRSSDPLEALGIVLEASRRTCGPLALALADSSGLLIAGAGPARACEDLAACAAAETPPGQTEISIMLEARAIEIRRLVTPRSNVLLCVEGEPGARRLS